MFKKILIGAGILVAGLVVVVLAQPSTYHVERSIRIAAPATAVWSQISDFSTWKNWSHWEKSDPTQKSTFAGTPGTVGHANTWVGEKTGQGTMAITSAEEPTRLDISLNFVEPMAGTATTTFWLAPDGDGTRVKWTMEGDNGFVGKAIGLFVSMDEMIGKAYDDGLANLKTIAEQQARATAAAAEGNPAAGPTP